MMIRVPRIPARPWNDPHPYGLPTFRLVLPTYTLDYAIIEIPDDDIAALIMASNPTITNVPTIGNVVTAIDPAAAPAVLAALKAKYRELASRWSVGAV